MSKRFTATEKWDKPWYRRLPSRLKCLWQFFCDRCDQAGVIEMDWELASFQIGEDVSASDLSYFADQIQEIGSGKLWLKAFVEFQYGKLSETCPAHKPVIRSIQKHFGDTNKIGYQYPIGRVQEEEEEMDKEKEEVKETEKKGKGTQTELEAYAVEIGLPASDGAAMFDHWTANGWKNGSTPSKCWKAGMRKWKGQGWMPSQKAKPNINGQRPPRNPAYNAETATAGMTKEQILNF